MTVEIAERAFEDAIERGLLQHGPDACVGDTTAILETSPEGDFYVRGGPGTVKLSPESAAEFIRTRFTAPKKAGPAAQA